ncbi:hypothetical protein [Kribbella sp. NBC_00889]|uniref:hypothetical protein n=1 Tax=Kribbella sp. NBC_00889 TaxID=2975974 RepID=UPI0038687FEC|nr:hypothetical protein OG817_00050 [Kribbella sp. NBC_00889]
MELTGRDFERIPRTNLHVPVREFARLWLTAERRGDAVLRAGGDDLYLLGVQMTCRWLAGVIKVVDGPAGRVPLASPAPITRQQERAYEELIAAEADAAERAVAQDRKDRGAGFVAGAHATLAWAWRWSGVPPIDVEQVPVKQTG